MSFNLLTQYPSLIASLWIYGYFPERMFGIFILELLYHVAPQRIYFNPIMVIF